MAATYGKHCPQHDDPAILDIVEVPPPPLLPPLPPLTPSPIPAKRPSSSRSEPLRLPHQLPPVPRPPPLELRDPVALARCAAEGEGGSAVLWADGGSGFEGGELLGDEVKEGERGGGDGG